MADPFASLPAELQVAVLESLPDLQSLYCLTCASRSAKESFEHYPVDITNSIVKSLTLEMRQLMFVVCLSPGTFSLGSSVDVELGTKHEKDLQVCSDGDNGNPLPFDTPISAIRSMIDSNRIVQSVAQCFLDTYINRLNSIEAEHTVPENLRFTAGVYRKPEKYPKGCSYKLKRTGSASWAESYRVIRALWRIRILLVCRPLASSTEFSEDVAGFDEKDPIDLSCAHIWTRLAGWEIDEIRPVMEFLDERQDIRAAMTARNVADYESLFSPEQSLSHMVISDAITLLSSPPPRILVFQLWGQDEWTIRVDNQAHRWFHACGSARTISPLAGVEWGPFRRLGFGLWDKKRMCTLELMSRSEKLDALDSPSHPTSGTGVVIGLPNEAFTWRSIRVNGEYIVEQVR